MINKFIYERIGTAENVEQENKKNLKIFIHTSWIQFDFIQYNFNMLNIHTPVTCNQKLVTEDGIMINNCIFNSIFVVNILLWWKYISICEAIEVYTHSKT